MILQRDKNSDECRGKGSRKGIDGGIDRGRDRIGASEMGCHSRLCVAVHKTSPQKVVIPLKKGTMPFYVLEKMD
jgi:hypothetical protein